MKNLLAVNCTLLAYLGTYLVDYSSMSPRVSVSPRRRLQDYGTLPTLFPHEGKEVIEEICRVVGAWGGLWVVLDRIDG